MPPPPDADLLDLGDDGVDIGRLGQTAAWGGLAALALFVAVLAARSETGAQRIAIADEVRRARDCTLCRDPRRRSRPLGSMAATTPARGCRGRPSMQYTES